MAEEVERYEIDLGTVAVVVLKPTEIPAVPDKKEEAL